MQGKGPAVWWSRWQNGAAPCTSLTDKDKPDKRGGGSKLFLLHLSFPGLGEGGDRLFPLRPPPCWDAQLPL